MPRIIDPLRYPAPRPNRGGHADILDSGSFQHPRTRIFPWVMTTTASSRRSISTPRIQGPALIKGLSIHAPFGVDPPQATIEIGTATIDVTEASVALTAPRPYTVLTELLNPFGVIAGAAGAGLPLTTVGTMQRWAEIPLDIIVDDIECVIVLAILANALVAGTFNGHLRVLEGVEKEALRFFL